jgi:chitinase
MLKIMSFAMVAVLAITSPALARKHTTHAPVPAMTLAIATSGYVDVMLAGYAPPTPEEVKAVQLKQQRILESCRGGMNWSVFLDCVSSEAATTDFGPGIVVYTLAKKPPMPEEVE